MQSGPFTQHGKQIPGVTVFGDEESLISIRNCQGTSGCRVCIKDAIRIRRSYEISVPRRIREMRERAVQDSRRAPREADPFGDDIKPNRDVVLRALSTMPSQHRAKARKQYKEYGWL